jgi:hypothetical protein
VQYKSSTVPPCCQARKPAKVLNISQGRVSRPPTELESLLHRIAPANDYREAPSLDIGQVWSAIAFLAIRGEGDLVERRQVKLRATLTRYRMWCRQCRQLVLDHTYDAPFETVHLSVYHGPQCAIGAPLLLGGDGWRGD